MAKHAEMGKNRTGIDVSPIHSERMISGAEEYTVDSGERVPNIAALQRQYIEEADPVGSVPLPATLRGALKSGAKKATGRNPEVLLNKLGQRLAFERSGVRLYEAVINKCEVAEEQDMAGPVTTDELQHIRDEELEHFRLLNDCIESLGADPTAETPDADVSGVAAMGIQKVLTDPRTTLPQCLEMLLQLELVDNASWELLIRLADEMGLKDVSEQFQRALEQEKEHVMTVRSWLEEMTLSAASKRVERRH